jgi:hypothetical protein
MMADYQLSSRTEDGCATADPRSLTNSDSAALGNTLLDDWHIDIFVRVIVVLYHDLLTDQHFAL